MGTARPYSPVHRPQTERAGAALTPTFLCRSRVERGTKMRFLLLTVALVAMVSAREPKVNVITLDSCMGTEAPVDANTRPLELREQDAAETGSGSRSHNPESRSAYVEEMEAMKPFASHDDGWLWYFSKPGNVTDFFQTE